MQWLVSLTRARIDRVHYLEYMMAVSNLELLEREVVESVVEELRRYGISVQDDCDERCRGH